MLGADRLGDEVGHEGRVDAARQPQDAALEAGLAQLAANEPGDDPARDVRVDRELVGQLEQRPPGVVDGQGRHGAHRAAVRRRRGRRRIGSVDGVGVAGATSMPGSEPGSGRRVRGQPRALRDDPAKLARLELETLVAQERQRDPLAPDLVEVDVDEVQRRRRRTAPRRSARPTGR